MMMMTMNPPIHTVSKAFWKSPEQFSNCTFGILSGMDGGEWINGTSICHEIHATGCPFCLSFGAMEMSHQPICRSYITSTYSVIVSGTFADECGISKYVHKLIINITGRNGINKRRKPNESLTKMSCTILHVKCITAIHPHTRNMVTAFTFTASNTCTFTRSLAIAMRPCDCCTIFKSGSIH